MSVRMLDVAQTAKRLGVSEKTVRRRISSGSIKAQNVGAGEIRPTWRIPENCLPGSPEKLSRIMPVRDAVEWAKARVTSLEARTEERLALEALVAGCESLKIAGKELEKSADALADARGAAHPKRALGALQNRERLEHYVQLRSANRFPVTIRLVRNVALELGPSTVPHEEIITLTEKVTAPLAALRVKDFWRDYSWKATRSAIERAWGKIPKGDPLAAFPAPASRDDPTTPPAGV